MPPRLARLLAVLVAAALVAGAFALRSALADGDGERVRTGSGSTGGGGDDGDRGPYTVLCDADLGDAACAALEDLADVAEVEVLTWSEVREREPGDLAAFDAWLTLDPLPDVLDEARRFANEPSATTGENVEVASAQLALLSRSAVDCRGEWGCVVDIADDEAIGVPASSTSTGVVATSAAFAALVDDAQRGIGALDDGDTRSRLRDLTASAERRPLAGQRTTFLTQVGSYQGIITTLPLADAAVDGPRGSGLQSAVLTPEVTIGVVLVGLGGGDGAVAALSEHVTEQTVLDALAEAGWEGEPAPTTGLPDPDVIDALQEELG